MLEGMDKMAGVPMHLRSMKVSTPCSDSIDVSIHQHHGESRLGTIHITCGGQSMSAESSAYMTAYAIEALRVTTSAGAQVFLDAICSRICAPQKMELAEVIENDGLSECRGGDVNLRFLPQWETLVAPRLTIRPTRPLPAELQKGSQLNFLTVFGSVPVSMAFCHVRAAVVEDGGTPGAPAVTHPSMNLSRAQQANCALAQRAVASALRVLGHLLSCAFSWLGGYKQAIESIVAPQSPLSFFAGLTPSGLLFADDRFLAATTHWERMILCSTALDALVVKSHQVDGANAIRVVDMPVKWRVDESQTNMVFVAIGDSLCYALCFRHAKPIPEHRMSAEAFVSFVRDNVAAHETAFRRDLGQPVEESQEASPIFRGAHSQPDPRRYVFLACSSSFRSTEYSSLLDELSTSEDDHRSDGCCRLWSSCLRDTKTDGAPVTRRSILLSRLEVGPLLCRCAARVARAEQRFFYAAHGVGLHSFVFCEKSTAGPEQALLDPLQPFDRLVDVALQQRTGFCVPFLRHRLASALHVDGDSLKTTDVTPLLLLHRGMAFGGTGDAVAATSLPLSPESQSGVERDREITLFSSRALGETVKLRHVIISGDAIGEDMSPKAVLYPSSATEGLSPALRHALQGSEGLCTSILSALVGATARP
jgi:hypothetical protein